MEQDPWIAETVLRGRPRWGGIWCAVAAGGALFGASMGLGGAWAGWVLVAIFLPCAIVLGLNLRPDANELRLDGDGYTLVTLRRAGRVAWTDVERIGVIDGVRGQLVAIRFSPAVASRIKDANEIAADMGGYHRTLPQSYGLEPTALAALMQRYRSGGRVL